MAEAWPATLPPIPQLPVSVTFPDTAIRFQTDVGPGFTRRRSTIARKRMNFRLVLESREQLLTFHTFWAATLRHGALPFDHYYPLTDSIEIMRFREPPEVTALGGDIFEAMLELEILPPTGARFDNTSLTIDSSELTMDSL